MLLRGVMFCSAWNALTPAFGLPLSRLLERGFIEMISLSRLWERDRRAGPTGRDGPIGEQAPWGAVLLKTCRLSQDSAVLLKTPRSGRVRVFQVA